MDKGRRVSRFSVEFCFVTVPKKVVGEPFSVSLISGIENVGIRGAGDFFPRKIICLTVPKNFVGEKFRVSLFLGTEKVWIRGGWGV